MAGSLPLICEKLSVPATAKMAESSRAPREVCLASGSRKTDAPAETVAPPTLLSLPTELQLQIVGFVQQPSDRKALCLSCKQMLELTTPHLYRTVKINFSCDTCTSGFFRFGHRGHKLIRSLQGRTPENRSTRAGPKMLDPYYNMRVRAAM